MIKDALTLDKSLGVQASRLVQWPLPCHLLNESCAVISRAEQSRAEAV